MELSLARKLGLSARTRLFLKTIGVKSIEDLVNLKVDEIEGTYWKGVGENVIAEITKVQDQIKSGVINIEELIDDKHSAIAMSEDVEAIASKHVVDELILSKRSYNCLRRSGINTLADLGRMSVDDLIAVPQLGKQSLEEILEKRELWFREFGAGTVYEAENTQVNEDDSMGNLSFYEDLRNLFKPIIDLTAREYNTLLCAYFEGIEIETIDALCSNDFRFILNLNEIKVALLRYYESMKRAGEDYVRQSDIYRRIEMDFDNVELVTELKNFFHGESFFNNAEYIFRKRTFLEERINGIGDDTKDWIVKERIKGRTLQEIADDVGVTRERIRQISAKHAKRIEPVYEDYYASVYKHFKLSKQQFMDAFPGADDRTYDYLSLRYGKGTEFLNRASIESYDGPFSEQLLESISRDEEASWKKSLTRQKITWIVLASNSGKYVDKEKFEELYSQFLEKNHLSKERYSFNPYYLSNGLRASRHAVFNRDGEFRYYEKDASVLWKKINFARYDNMVLSTELIFNDYEELMEDLDIWNGYELFCLLKNTETDKKFSLEMPDIVFRRIPIMIVGNGDEKKQIRGLLKENSPIAYFDLYKLYEERYGVRKESAGANLGAYVEQYLHSGVYTANLPEIAESDRNAFKEELDKKELWSIRELEKIFERTCLESDADALNVTSLYKLGYSLYSGYAYNQKYVSASDCLNAMVFNTDVVDINEVDEEIQRLQIFWGHVNKLRECRDYYEISPKIYASRAFVEREYGITDEVVDEIIRVTEKEAEENKFYNAYSIWPLIKDYPCIKKLNDNLWLCNSILRIAPDVHSLPVAGTIILTKEDKDELLVVKICEWIVQNNGKMSIDRLTESMNELFGARFEKSKIIQKIREKGAEYLLTDNIEEYLEQIFIKADGLMDDEDDLFKEEFF